MDYEPAGQSPWAASGDGTHPPSGGIHGHAHTFPHAHRKHHHSHGLSPGGGHHVTKHSQSATLPNQIPPSLSSGAAGVNLSHVHPIGGGSASSSAGYHNVYPTHTNLDCTTSGSMNMPLGGFRTSGHHHGPNIHKPQSIPAVLPSGGSHVAATSGGSSATYTTTSGGMPSSTSSSSGGYGGYSISAQATVNPGLVSAQSSSSGASTTTTRQGEESPMHGVCVQQSPVASH